MLSLSLLTGGRYVNNYIYWRPCIVKAYIQYYYPSSIVRIPWRRAGDYEREEARRLDYHPSLFRYHNI